MKKFLGERKTKSMLKLRTVYPYGLNEKIDICEDDKNVKVFNGVVEELLFKELKESIKKFIPKYKCNLELVSAIFYFLPNDSP